MREIKFRAWNIKSKYMDDDFYIHSDGRGCFFDSEETYNTPNIEIDSYDNLIVMQYIGLKDMNDKEIYEDDIIRKNTRKYKIVFFDGSFRAIDEYGTHIICTKEFTDQIEVIGNIHENP